MTQDTDQKIFLLHQRAKELILDKKEEDYIISELIKEGIQPGYAVSIIENVRADLSNKKKFRKELFKGISITVFGLLLNIGSFLAFSNSGSFFWIAYWGVMVFGITVIARAFIIFKK